MTLPRFLSRFAALFAAAVLFVAAPVRAQDAPDSGWFDPNETAEPPPAADAADVEQRDSIPPSPLLQQRSGGSASDADLDPADTDPRALQDFRPKLDPYGSWVQHPTYGTVWVPNASYVGTNFAPYVSSGHWALTDDGDWIWVSDYPFGSVVFHYGRWVWVSGTGWAWIPGYRYAPAWVTWRVPTGSYAYVGWAPMGPDFIWYNGAAVSFWWGTPTPWVFVPSSYVFYPHVHYYVVRDRVLLPRLAAHSRRYAPAAPRGVARVGARGTARAYSSAAPRGVARTPARGPSLSDARVPSSAAPRDRVRAVPPIAPSTRSAAAPSRFDSRAFERRRGSTAEPQRYVAPVPRSGSSSSSGVAPRPSSPRPAAAPRSGPSPERVNRLRPARDAPAPRLAPAPARAPRTFSPAPAPRLPRPRH